MSSARKNMTRQCGQAVTSVRWCVHQHGFVTPRKWHAVVLVPEVWDVWLRKKPCAR